MFDNIASKKSGAYKRQDYPLYGQRGFTIVELLIVIVVIAILAAIIIAVYNGLQTRAADSVLRSDISNAAKQLGLDNAVNGVYPTSQSAANDGNGLPKSPATDYRYSYVAANNSYCLTGFSTHAGVSVYHISSDNGAIQDGPCTGHTVPVGSGGNDDNTVVVSTFAGSGVGGDVDGTGVSAQFFCPHSLAADGSGNFYVADACNSRIRKISPAGEVTTLAGSIDGFADGTGTSAQFYGLTDLAIDSSGNIYVTDEQRIRKITPAGVVTTLAGMPRTVGYVDGAGTAARFFSPYGVAVDSSGNLYIADSQNNRIRKMTPSGVVSTFAGSGEYGYADGTGTDAKFRDPVGLTIDNAGNLYVADEYNQRIRKITPAGVVTTIAGSGEYGHADGTGTDAEFYYPMGIAIDNAGNLYVSDTHGHRIRKVTPAGVVTTLAGSGEEGYADGVAASAQFSWPVGMVVSGNKLYIADYGNHRIRMIHLP